MKEEARFRRETAAQKTQGRQVCWMENRGLSFAVIVSGIDEEYQNMVLRGIQKYASDHAVTICRFVAFGGVLKNQKHDAGEYHIYRLANFSRFDGVILLTNTIASEAQTEQVLSRVHAAGIPAVCIDGEPEGAYSVGIDNYKAMYALTEHFLRDHGVRRLNYISGPDGNPESRQRYQAFCDALAAYDVPLDPRRVYHGAFRSQDGRDAAEAFLKMELPFPEAIICANDVMALSALMTLEEHGVRAPQDVLISGFDNIDRARNYSPELTSVARPLFESGYQACELLLRHIRGENPERTVLLDTIPIFTESCGCHNAMGDSIEAFKRANYQVLERYRVDVQRNNRMISRLTEADSMEENIGQLKEFLKEISCGAFYLCLCTDWYGMKEHHDGCWMRFELEDCFSEGYTPEMTIALAYRDGAFCTEGTFSTAQMLPAIWEQQGCHIYDFLPVHFRERCLGYCVFQDSDFPMQSPVFRSWIMHLSNALENVRKIICMDMAVQKLDQLYVIDSLSEIYNRNGFARGSKALYDRCIQERLPVMVMFLDMDDLKYINDHFGHKAGDDAIRVVGRALQEICDHGEVYSRFGGDEFQIFGAGYTKEMAETLEERLQAYFRGYNVSSGRPYQVGASIGYHIAVPDAKTSLFGLMTIADQEMYEVKKQRKLKKLMEN